MPFKKKPTVKVGKGSWIVEIPRPPAHSTHAELKTDEGQTALLRLEDFACFRGVSGWFRYLRMDNKLKLLEKHKKKWYWNGAEVDGIDKLT